MPLALVARRPAHRPREILRIVPLDSTACYEQLWHLSGIHVSLDRRVGRRPGAVEDQQDFIASDEPAGLFDGFRRTVSVVIGNEPDLAPVDAAFGVHLVEIRRDGFTDDALSRRGPAVGHDIANLDLSVARTGLYFFCGVAEPATIVMLPNTTATVIHAR